MAGFSKACIVRRRGLVGLSLLAVVLSLILGAWLWQAAELSSVSRVSDQVERLKPIASAVRLALIGLLAALWPRWVGLAFRHGRIGESQRDKLLAQRWRAAGWLLIIELLLGQNLLGRLFTAATGSLS